MTAAEVVRDYLFELVASDALAENERPVLKHVGREAFDLVDNGESGRAPGRYRIIVDYRGAP